MALYRIASLVLASLLLMTLASSGMMAGVPDIDRAPRAITYIDGDWVISGVASNSSEEIMLTGNLIIQNGGSLSLDNVTLRMNCASSGQYRIEVQNGGTFYMDGGSLITNGLAPTVGYLFQVNAVATLDARNSTIEKCGLLGLAGAEASGMRILSNNATFENISISGCANGIIADSCVVRMGNSTVSGNLFNGILISDTAAPGAASGALLSNVAISSNGNNGISGQASEIMVSVTGGSIDRNKAGIILDGSSNLDVGIEDCQVVLNTPGGGIWLDGGSGVSDIKADIINSNISGNQNTPLRLGFLGSEEPARSVYLNLTGNSVLSSNSNDVGVLYVLATDHIYTNLTQNDFIQPYMKYGLHIGRVIDTLNIHPAAKKVEALLWSNNISINAGGVLNICAIENMTATMIGNRIFNDKKIIECGALSIGWFSAGWDGTTPDNLTLVMKHNSISNLIDGAVGVKAIHNIWANISDNNIIGAYGGALRLGWLDEGDTKYTTKLWSKPTRNVRAQIYQNYIRDGSGNSIWVYSSNGSAIYSNTILNKPYSGDGIRIQGTQLPTAVHDNNVKFHNVGSGIKLEQASNVSIYSNTLENNLYGIGFDRGSHGNIIFSNTIKKTDDKYGFFFNTNSLDNDIPANNTVNGTALKKFHKINGTPGALASISGISVSWPKMSNLGQIIISNSTYLDVTGNQASNGASGIGLVNVQSSVIHANTLTSGAVGQGSGISLLASSGNVVRNNALTNNSFGLALMPNSAGNRLWENTITKFQDSRTGIYIDPNGSAFDNDIPTNNTVNGESVRYYNGVPTVNLDGLNITVGNLTNLGQIFVAGSDEASISNTSIRGGINGIHVSNTAVLTVRETSVGPAGTGLFASSVNALAASGSTFSGSVAGVQLSGSNAVFHDCFVSGALPVKIASASSFLLRNVTRSEGQSEVSADSTMRVEWYADIRAESMGLPLQGARVNLTDANGLVIMDAATDDGGTVPTANLIEYIRTGNAYDNRTPYHLNVTKGGYSGCYVQLPMNASISLTANLTDISSPALTLLVIAPSASIGTSASTVWLNATLDDSQNGNNTVTGAEYVLAPWYSGASAPSALLPRIPMPATDGAFDSPIEAVSSSVDVSGIAKGRHTFWVRGNDSLGNWCQWVAADLNITDDEIPMTLAPPNQSHPANLSIGTTWFNVTFTDVATGNSNIISAEWAAERLDTAESMGRSAISRPLDGSFNEPEEDVSVKIVFSAWTPGEYSIRFRAMDSSGNLGQWSEKTFFVIDDVAPSAPRGLTVANTTMPGELALVWNSNSEADLAGYHVYRSETSASGFTLVSTVGRNVTRWTDTGLANDTVYYYTISAYDTAETPNESPRSTEASARTIAPSSIDTPTNDDAGANSPLLVIASLVIVVVILSVLIILWKKKSKPKE